MRTPTLAFVLALAACGPPPHAGTATSAPVDAAGGTPPSMTAPPTDRAVVKPKAPAGPLTIAQARRYMVELINADRASMGLDPVVLDEGPATAAGQSHADDMAGNGFLGHWGTDGSVPEQRHSEAGGADMVLENASCFVDEAKRALDPQARIAPANVEKAEQMFFNEEPPHDGHRRNILNPRHKRVGIGIAQPVATQVEIPVPCFSQEFVDPYGSYDPVPKQMRAGDTLHVEGTILAPASVGGIGLARIDAPHALSVKEANATRRRAYPVPAPTALYWPPGYKTPIPVQVNGAKFAIDVPIADGAGMYELSIWARFPGAKDPVMVGLRTIQVK
jgi:uncharacterized protein YkwD